MNRAQLFELMNESSLLQKKIFFWFFEEKPCRHVWKSWDQLDFRELRSSLLLFLLVTEKDILKMVLQFMERSLVDWYLTGKACMWEQITMRANPIEEQTHPLCNTTCHDLVLHVSPGNNVPQTSPTYSKVWLCPCQEFRLCLRTYHWGAKEGRCLVRRAGRVEEPKWNLGTKRNQLEETQQSARGLAQKATYSTVPERWWAKWLAFRDCRMRMHFRKGKPMHLEEEGSRMNVGLHGLLRPSCDTSPGRWRLPWPKAAC